ncbi:MAG TPA: AMP-binding protein [Pseudogracilibacillus sp.]|nr:AMP-binding protein [Pseudogracilibacillus sp.]
MNIAHMINKNIEEYGEYPLISFNNTNFTNVEINKRANQLAKSLRDKGIVEDDRVLVMLPNIPDVLISYQAVMRLGAIIVPISDSLNKHEVDYVIQNCEPTAVITNDVNASKITTEAYDYLKQLIIINHDDVQAHLQAPSDEWVEIVEKQKDDVVAIIYTSGTTGLPKGAMITHGNIYSVHMEVQGLGLLDKNQKSTVETGFSMLVVLPISHIFGLTVTMMSYLIGARIVLMPRFELEEMFTLIEKENIRLLSGVPTIFYRMAQYAESVNVNVSSVDYWITGAAPLSEDVRAYFENVFQKRLLEGYGLTETTSSFALQRPDSIKVNSVGKSFPESEVAVFSEEGEKLPKGSIGELAIKGPNVMKGYYKMPRETEETIRDGWLMTGDVGYIDEDNDIFIIDRKKDIIIRGGFNVYPVEVEKVLQQHPDVAIAGVVGEDNDELGEVVKAYVTVHPGKIVREEDIILYCKDKLSSYKTPESVVFLPELPINELGKVVRKKLRNM